MVSFSFSQYTIVAEDVCMFNIDTDFNSLHAGLPFAENDYGLANMYMIISFKKYTNI